MKFVCRREVVKGWLRRTQVVLRWLTEPIFRCTYRHWGAICRANGAPCIKRHVCWYRNPPMSCLLLVPILGTSEVIAGWVPTCDSVHSSWVYSAVPLGDQAISTMAWYPTQSHYPDTEPTSLFPNLIMPSIGLWSHKYQFLSHWFDSTRVPNHEVRIHQFPKMGDRYPTHSVRPSGRSITTSTFHVPWEGSLLW